MKLEQSQIDHYVESILKDKITFQGLQKELSEMGFEGDNLKAAFLAINTPLKEKLGGVMEKAKEDEEYFSAGLIISFIYSFMAAMLGMESMMWYAVSIVILGAVGYFCFRNNRIAGVVATILFFILVMVVTPMYLEGRESVWNLELLLIAAVCAIPSGIILALASKMKSL